MVFNEYIKNKRVAVVGPAGYVSNFNNKDLIESYDIVMRFNATLPIHDNMISNIGVRTDILCNGLDNNPISCGEYNSKLWNELGVKWIFCPYSPHLDYQVKHVKSWAQHNNGLIPTHFTDTESFRKVNDDMNTRPNTGLLGVMYLLRNNIKEMLLTGFSFGVGSYDHHMGYKDTISSKDRSSTIHDQSEQLEYFKNQYKIHRDVINTDEYLHSVLVN